MTGAALTRAQTNVPAPPTQQDIERAAPPAETDAASRLKVNGGPATAPCPLDDPALADRRVAFAGARFDGLRGLDGAALRPAYESFVGKQITLGTLCRIRDAAGEILRRAGYVAALTVPEQDAADGTVRFTVVMARLVRIDLRGNATGAERRLATYLRKLTDEPLFNSHQAERYLLLARDMPGYDVSLTLAPADGAPGDVIGILSASRTPLVVESSVQNYGSKSVGRWGGLVTAAWNDPLGLGDRFTLGVFSTYPPREQLVVQSGYEARVGGEGLTLAGRLTYARTRPAIGGGDPYRSQTWVGTAEASYPFRRSQGFSLTGRAGIDIVDQDLNGFGATLTRDRLRAGYVELDITAADRREEVPRWRAAATIELRQGIGILGASKGCSQGGAIIVCPSPLPSRLQADTTATILRGAASLEYRLDDRFTIAAAPRLQYAFQPLIAYEQYSAGAYTIGRGYDPAAATGDSGAGTSLELRYGRAVSTGRIALQPYAFVDAAWVWNRQALEGEQYPQRIVSAGGGLRASIGDVLRADLGVATPLRRAPEQVVRGETRVLLTLTGRLWPWARR